MTLDQAALQIARNAPDDPGFDEAGFLGLLHRQHVWETREYDLLRDALRARAQGSIASDERARGLTWPLFRIFSHLALTMLTSHLDPDDLYRIENLDDGAIFERRCEVQALFEAVFRRIGVTPCP